MQSSDAGANLGMAKVLMAQHEVQKAVPYLERAAHLEPFNASTHYRLAVVYRDLERTEDSRHEMAEFEKLKKMKARLSDLYQQMRLSPGKAGESESDLH
jgi:Flp pilus assembly protein TadD